MAIPNVKSEVSEGVYVVGVEAFLMLGPSPTLGSLGPSHQQRLKSRVSLRGPPCAHGISGTPHGEVHDSNGGDCVCTTASVSFFMTGWHIWDI